MQEVLPIVIICCAGLAVCAALLVALLAKYLSKKLRKKKEQFELDDKTLTVRLDKKDLRK